MAQIKISELELNTQMSNEDVLAGVDTSEQKTKKFKLETLKTFINKEQDEQVTKNKNDISANATNIKTNAENISKNSENIEKNAQDIVENKENIADNTNRIKRIENTLYDSGEANGTSINIKDSTLAEFQEITVDGVCEQVTTTGKNLLPISKLESKTINGITFTNNQDGTYTLKGTATSLVNLLILENKNETIKLEKNEYYSYSFKVLNGNVNFAIPCSVIDNDGAVTYNYLTNADPTKLTDKEYTINNISFYITSGQNIDCTIAIQLEKNSTVTEYEPYTGGQASPSPSWEQPIEVIEEDFEVVSCGKNRLLFEPHTYTSNGIVTEFDGKKFKIKGIASTNWAKLTRTIVSNLEAGIYTLSKYKETPFQLMLQFYDDDKLLWTKYLGKPDTKVTFTLNEKVTKIALGIDNITAGDEIDVELEVQVEKGSTSTEYEAPISSRVPINLPDGEFVGKINENAKDQVRIDFNEDDGEYKPKLSKKLGRDVLDGSEYWQLVNSTSDYYEYQTIISSKPALNNYTFAISTHFSNKTNNRIVMNDKVMLVRVPASANITTVDEFKNYLSENNVEYFYQLAEPYEVDLGVIDMPLSYSPETNVFTTSELEAIINAKYYRNFINTIQNLQVNEKALQQELVDINSRLSALETNLVNLANVESESEE